MPRWLRITEIKYSDFQTVETQNYRKQRAYYIDRSSDVNKELFKKKVDIVEKSGKLKIEATNPEYKRGC